MKSKGFTLIELMIVVAIIGIIAAVLAPAYQKWKNGGNANYDIPQGTVVHQVTQPTYTCQNGILVDGQGQPMVRDGAAVTCK